MVHLPRAAWKVKLEHAASPSQNAAQSSTFGNPGATKSSVPALSLVASKGPRNAFPKQLNVVVVLVAVVVVVLVVTVVAVTVVVVHTSDRT
jgi:hypothetical protein